MYKMHVDVHEYIYIISRDTHTIVHSKKLSGLGIHVFILTIQEKSIYVTVHSHAHRLMFISFSH